MNRSSLLTKAISLSDHSGPDFDADPISQLEAIEPGLNAPFEVFKLICRLMKFNHAALLMADPEEKRYFPVIYRNFDRTTAMRLEIPEKTMEGLISREIKIQRYFSYADAKTIHDYALFDLSSGKQKVYLLFTVTSGDPQELIQDSFLEENRDLISQQIKSYEKGNIATLKREVAPLFLIQANQFIKKNQSRNRSFYLFFIDAKKTIERIVGNEGLKPVNSFRIESRCRDIFENNIEDFGKLTRINYGEFFIILQLENSISPELIESHFNHSLASDFSQVRKWKSLEISHNKYFETVSTVGKAAELLLAES